jgi:hypothetical protein
MTAGVYRRIIGQSVDVMRDPALMREDAACLLLRRRGRDDRDATPRWFHASAPNDPALVGASVLLQALSGPKLSGPGKSGAWTNCVEITIQ